MVTVMVTATLTVPVTVTVTVIVTATVTVIVTATGTRADMVQSGRSEACRGAWSDNDHIWV